jgi:glycosyltransferase involved in cell wall biosynthesis
VGHLAGPVGRARALCGRPAEGPMTPPLPLLHRLWRRLPAGSRRRMAMRLAALAAPRPDAPPPVAAGGVIVAGELSRASGLGESARLMLRGLAALGVPTWPIDIGRYLPAHRNDLPQPPQPDSSPPSGAPLVLHVNPPLLPLVLARLPRAIVRNRHLVGYWYWELPIAPAEWRLGARYVHNVWAPSRFTADALAPLVDAPIRAVRPPVAINPLAPAPVNRAHFGLPTRAVIVFSSFNLASSFVRKNPLGSIEAFRMAFGARSDRMLVLKVGNPDHFPDDFTRLVTAAAAHSNIHLVTDTLAPGASLALTASADIVLSLHRSEGFGLVAAEGMLLGKPVVATDWSATTEFMDATCAALVPSRLVPAEDARGIYAVSGAEWAEADLGHAADWLRRLADDPDLRRTLGGAAHAAALERLGTGSLAQAVSSLGLQVRQEAVLLPALEANAP